MDGSLINKKWHRKNNVAEPETANQLPRTRQLIRKPCNIRDCCRENEANYFGMSARWMQLMQFTFHREMQYSKQGGHASIIVQVGTDQLIGHPVIIGDWIGHCWLGTPITKATAVALGAGDVVNSRCCGVQFSPPITAYSLVFYLCGLFIR